MQAGLTRTKRIVFFMLMITLTAIIAFVTIELGLARYYSQEQPQWTEFHPVLGWSLRPGQYNVKALQRLSSFPITITKLGLRSHDSELGEENKKRVLILGDSFVFAKETRTERMFSARLQHLLDESRPGTFEVMNAGVPAYGTAQQLLLMRELNEKHGVRADIYLLVFFTNDILDNLCLSYGNLSPQPVRPRFAVNNEGEAVLVSPPSRDKGDGNDDTLVTHQQAGRIKTISVVKALTEEWLQTKPDAVRFLTRIGFDAKLARVPGILNGWYREEIAAEGVALTGALIRQIRDQALKNGGKLLLTMVPSPLQVYSKTYVPLLENTFRNDPVVTQFANDILRPQSLISSICRDAAIPFHDLFPVCVENGTRRLFIPRDGHLTDAGHEVVSKSLFEFVSQHLAE